MFTPREFDLALQAREFAKCLGLFLPGVRRHGAVQAGQSERGIEPPPQAKLAREARDCSRPLLVGHAIVEVIAEELIRLLRADVVAAGGVGEVAATGW